MANTSNKGCKKAGRAADSAQNKAYKSQYRWNRNRMARLTRHLARQPNDAQARKALHSGRTAR